LGKKTNNDRPVSRIKRMIETERERMRKTNMFAAFAVSILSALFTTAAA
jgi:hypothetical protein